MVVEKIYEYYVDDGTLFTSAKSYDTNARWTFQTFTVGIRGDNEKHICTKVKMKLRKVGSPTGNSKIYIMDGVGTSSTTTVPDDEILAEATLDVSTLTTSFAYYEISFNLATELNVSGNYAIILTYPSGTHGATDYIEWAGDNSSSYGGGQPGYSETEGATWANAYNNLVFIEIGTKWETTACQYKDVVSKTGSNVASTLGSGSKLELLNGFALQAQSVVCAITRFNWVDEYANLNADVKYLLNEAVSNLAGIYGISYDMSGYTSRIEAEDMINILRDNWLRAMSMLRSQKTKTFIDGA